MRPLPPKMGCVVAAATILFCFACRVPAFAAVANVSVINFAFVPATTNIAAGDTVIWTWPAGSTSHNVHSTSSPEAWTASPIASGPFTFTNTFAAAGNYPYNCAVHGFTGQITVTAVNVPPTNSITGPAANAVFAAPANVTIDASASDSDGSVTNVQFRVGVTVLTNQTTTPYFATAGNLGAGNYTLFAIASDNVGATATSSVPISVVTPVTVLATNGAKLSGTNFQFTYSANVGLSYVIQRSTNPAANWVSLVTNIAASNPVVFMDIHATNSPNFYRVGRLPNP